MTHAPIQDVITFSKTVQETIVNKTVKIKVVVVAVIDKGVPEEETSRSIHSLLKSFVDTDKWAILSTKRTSEIGRERLTVRAEARVDDRENSSIEERRRALEKPGLVIQTVEVDDSISQATIEETQEKLRTKIAEYAVEQAVSYGNLIPSEDKLSETEHKLPQRDYRVQSIAFQEIRFGEALKQQYNAPKTYSATMMTTASFTGGSDAADEGDTLGSSQVVSLTAQIVLARIVKEP